MQSQSYTNTQTPATPLLLTAWSVTTTLADWLALPADVRKRTTKAAQSLPYKDTARSRWEAGRAAAAKKVR